MSTSNPQKPEENEGKAPQQEGTLTEDNAKKALLDEEKIEEKTSTDQPVVRGDEGNIESLGKAETPEIKKAEQSAIDRVAGLEVGYKKMPMESLPSEGYYNSKDFGISFRSASLEEIKHYSSMNESDMFDVTEKISTVLNTCMRININGRQGSYEDLMEFDKIYMLFAIRDLSMTKHHRENKIFQEIECPQCDLKIKKEITNDVFGYIKLEDNVMKHYDVVERGFVFKDDSLGSPLKVYVPSVGVLKYIADYMKDKEIEKRQGKGGFYDKQFLTFLQFLVKDWRSLNEGYVSSMYKDYKENWSYDKHDFMIAVTEKINITIKATIEMKCERGHVANPLVFFRGGYRSILGLSNVAERLFN